MANHKIINSRAPRIDAADKVTGKAVYIDDMHRPNMLYAALLQSPVAHGRIVKLDTERARALPGVVDIITAKEIGEVQFGVSPARYDETVFAKDKVRYAGEEIAAVAAKDLETARRAIQLIDLEIEALPAVLDAASGLEQDAPQLFERYQNNVTAEVSQHFGDVDKAHQGAFRVYTDHLQSKMQDGAFMEPNGCIAEQDHRGYLTLYSSTQSPHYVQRTVAMVLKLPLHKVRVVKPHVGGGFGPKVSASNLELAVSCLACRTKRPVKSIFTREQIFLRSRARHQFLHQMTLGVNEDGTLAFLDHEAVLDGGAYSSFGIATIYYAGSLLGGPYRLPNMRYHGVRVCTNKPACGAQRGHGGVIARALFESLLDRAAEDLHIDPVALRLKNMMSTGETTCNDLNMSSLGMRECVESVRDASSWSKRDAFPGFEGQGMGMACGFFVSGAGYPIYRSDTYHSTATVQLSEVGGGVVVRSGAAEIGQGSDTAIAMIAAEELGIPLEDVRVISGDTDAAMDLGAYSSRQTLMTGHAVRMAAIDARNKVAEVLGQMLGVEPNQLIFSDGFVDLAGGGLDIEAVRKTYMREHRGFEDHPIPGDRLTFREASRIAFNTLGTIVGTGRYKPPVLGGKYKGAAVGTSPAYGCSAQIAEVTVDMETGNIACNRVTMSHDCGYAINRTQVEGQMQGNFLMGFGEALFEEVKFDDTGRTINANLAEYKVPTTVDVPELVPIVVESVEPNGPYGAKEVGEGGIMPVIPAILNAVYAATGVRFRELPLTPERVLKGIQSRHGNGGSQYPTDGACKRLMALLKQRRDEL
ncbi:MAG: molybdopterin-dependent oxidoreductase [Myxococcota bacterium]|nr:molybdopterin-dependent oxidoreductase [Myxococcota bacterium]